ncbi:MAG: exo-alpha-sialidase [Kiritimatiellae bacterium]|nr:exo-alpha-sialidase [Kiritimatiellia bacterium]
MKQGIVFQFALTAWVLTCGVQAAETPVRGNLADATLQPIRIQMPPPLRYRDPANIVYQTGPSIAVAPNGRIWVAIMTGGVDEENRNYVDLLTSGDGGDTWSEPKMALDIDGPMRTFDPGMWTDPEGRVWLFWCQVYDFWDGRGGLWTTVCDDPGKEDAAWSPPRRLCDGVMKNKPLVLSNGDRWLLVEQWQDDTSGWHWDYLKKQPRLPEWYHTDTPHIGANVYRSTDKGATWSYWSTAPVPQNVRTCDEHMAIERKDGTFRMLLRTKYGMGECTSSDGGRTWTPVVPSAIKNPAARFHFCKLRSGNVLLVKNGPIDVQTDRRDIIAYLSEDDGQTFPFKLPLDIRPKPSYPDVSQGADGRIYSVHDFDRRGIGEIILDVFTEDDIRAGKIVSPGSRLHRIVRKNAPKLMK